MKAWYLLLFLFCIFFIYLLMFPLHESFSSSSSSFSIPNDCPNVLIQKDSKFYLYNTKRIDVPGVNPIVFDNLEEYVEFIKYQKRMGWNCPILYLQQTLGAQGNPEFRLRPDVLEPQAGINPMLPSQMHDMLPYEQKMANDALAQTLAQNVSVSSNVPLTQKELANLDLTASTLSIQNTSRCQGEDIKPPLIYGKSPDPMQDEWGGIAFSEKLVDSGYYAGNEIYKTTPGVNSLNAYNPTVVNSPKHDISSSSSLSSFPSSSSSNSSSISPIPNSTFYGSPHSSNNNTNQSSTSSSSSSESNHSYSSFYGALDKSHR